MDWRGQVFHYCERGLDAGFWAEPVNALTNAAFVLVGALALARLARQAQPPVCGRPMAVLLAATVIAIGVGSFLFHTLATRWARLADTLPIALFMVAYLAFALRCLVGLGWLPVAAGVVAFVLAHQAAAGIDCQALAAAVDPAEAGRCFNGTLGYAPALLTLCAIGIWLQVKRHPAAGALLAAGGVLLVSMALRTVDVEWCAATRIGGLALGTHFLWHVLNALVLHLLLGAVMRR